MLTLPSDLTKIDGSLLEGGGQIIRISSALSALLNKPIEIENIRQNKGNGGGLRAQHLTGLKLIEQLCDGKLYGGEIGSRKIKFVPNELKSGRFIGDTQTAGSVCLLMQSTIPCALFTSSQVKLDLRGGTNAEHAPQIDYYERVFQGVVEKFGVKFETQVLRRGYYPKGGGELHVVIDPIQILKPIELVDFGKLMRITGKAFVAGFLPIKIAQNMAITAKKLLDKEFNDVSIEIEVIKEPDNQVFGVGTGLILTAETTSGCKLGSSSLGKKGLSAEQVAKEAVDSLVEDLSYETCVDKYLQDQLIIFMALADGTSRIKCGPLTLHTQTAIRIVEMLTNAHFEISHSNEKSCFIECKGIGFKNKNL